MPGASRLDIKTLLLLFPVTHHLARQYEVVCSSRAKGFPVLQIVKPANDRPAVFELT